MFSVGYCGILRKYSVWFPTDQTFLAAYNVALTVKSLSLFFFCVRLLNNTEDIILKPSKMVD
jgi:hypothetical protein